MRYRQATSKTRTLFLAVFSLFIYGASALETMGEEQNVTLHIIAHAPSHTEMLTIEQSGNKFAWKLVVPRKYRAAVPKFQRDRAEYRLDDGYAGSIEIEDAYLKDIFTAVVKHQVDNDVEAAKLALGPSVTLALLTKEGSRMSMPLSAEFLRKTGRQVLEPIRKDMLAHSILVKTLTMDWVLDPEPAQGDVGTRRVTD